MYNFISLKVSLIWKMQVQKLNTEIKMTFNCPLLQLNYYICMKNNALRFVSEQTCHSAPLNSHVSVRSILTLWRLCESRFIKKTILDCLFYSVAGEWVQEFPITSAPTGQQRPQVHNFIWHEIYSKNGLIELRTSIYESWHFLIEKSGDQLIHGRMRKNQESEGRNPVFIL